MVGESFSHYRIVEELGGGGMGVVYRAIDTTLDREVAIKFPRPRDGAEKDNRRILEEARAASALNHPNIAAIYDFGEHRDQPYIVMEYVEGPELRTLLKQRPLSVVETLFIGEQVAAALDTAHQRSVVHRDIKPSNIRFASSRTVKVLDFGIAQRVRTQVPQLVGGSVSTETVQSAIEGTFGYMSPEQVRGHAADGRSDVFSLGAVMYECLTQHRAFTGETNQDIMAATLVKDPPPPSRLNASVSAEVDALVMAMLAKRRDVRPTAAQVLPRIRALRTRAESTTEEMPLGSGTGGRIRRRVVASAIAAILILVLWGGAKLWNRAYQPSPEALHWYRQGVSGIRNGSFLQASRALERAVEKDPGFRLARARYAEALAELDYISRAREEMLRASPPTAPQRLERDGAVQFDAIHATLANNYDAAIAKYQTLLKRTSGAEHAGVLLDLGRVYEKASKPEEAMAAYQEAAKLQPHSAAAFLRMGVLRGRAGDLESAEKFFAEAETLYRASSNTEGLAEVDLERSRALNRKARIAEALEAAEKALVTARKAGSIQHEISILLQMSSALFHSGDPLRSEQAAARAVESAREHSLETFAARGLISLGSAVMVKGDLAVAERHFRQALEEARRSHAQIVEARALFNLAQLLDRLNRTQEALAALEPALAIFRQDNRVKETAQVLILLARLKRDQGDIEGARRAFEEQLAKGKQLDDADLTGLAYEGLATLAERQGRFAEALAHYQQRYFAAKSRGIELAMAFGALNSGVVLSRMGRAAEARSRFAEAAKLAGGKRIKQVTDGISLNRAKLATYEENWNDVRAYAAPLLADPRRGSEAALLHGLALVKTGDAARGLQQVQTAAAKIEAGRDPLLSQMASYVQAAALLASGSAAAARKHALEAAQKAISHRAVEEEWLALAMACAATKSAGDPAWRELQQRASQTFERMIGPWATEDSAIYRKRPDVHRLLALLDRSLT